MSTTYPTCPYKKGDLVMFANRSQITDMGMEVQAVNTNMFDARLKVRDQWWRPGNLMPYAEWAKLHRPERMRA